MNSVRNGRRLEPRLFPTSKISLGTYTENDGPDSDGYRAFYDLARQ